MAMIYRKPTISALFQWCRTLLVLLLGLAEATAAISCSHSFHQEKKFAFHLSPGTDNILLKRHNLTHTFDVEGWQLDPGFVIACLAQLDQIRPGDNAESCLLLPVPRETPEMVTLDNEATPDFTFKGLSRDQLLTVCRKIQTRPPLPRPLGQLVLFRPNLELPGENPADSPVDIWIPNKSLNHNPAACQALISAMEEMQSLTPTPGRPQEIRKTFPYSERFRIKDLFARRKVTPGHVRLGARLSISLPFWRKHESHLRQRAGVFGLFQ